MQRDRVVAAFHLFLVEKMQLNRQPKFQSKLKGISLDQLLARSKIVI
jgi:hypothetical protein